MKRQKTSRGRRSERDDPITEACRGVFDQDDIAILENSIVPEIPGLPIQTLRRVLSAIGDGTDPVTALFVEARMGLSDIRATVERLCAEGLLQVIGPEQPESATWLLTRRALRISMIGPGHRVSRSKLVSSISALQALLDRIEADETRFAVAKGIMLSGDFLLGHEFCRRTSYTLMLDPRVPDNPSPELIAALERRVAASGSSSAWSDFNNSDYYGAEYEVIAAEVRKCGATFGRNYDTLLHQPLLILRPGRTMFAAGIRSAFHDALYSDRLKQGGGRTGVARYPDLSDLHCTDIGDAVIDDLFSDSSVDDSSSQDRLLLKIPAETREITDLLLFEANLRRRQETRRPGRPSPLLLAFARARDMVPTNDVTDRDDGDLERLRLITAWGRELNVDLGFWTAYMVGERGAWSGTILVCFPPVTEGDEPRMISINAGGGKRDLCLYPSDSCESWLSPNEYAVLRALDTAVEELAKGLPGPERCHISIEIAPCEIVEPQSWRSALDRFVMAMEGAATRGYDAAASMHIGNANSVFFPREGDDLVREWPLESRADGDSTDSVSDESDDERRVISALIRFDPAVSHHARLKFMSEFEPAARAFAADGPAWMVDVEMGEE